MPKSRYRFSRSDSMEGFLSRDRPSTDALKVLAIWRDDHAGRNFSKEVDEDEQLVAALSWNDSDDLAGPSLDKACRKFGVMCTHENT